MRRKSIDGCKSTLALSIVSAYSFEDPSLILAWERIENRLCITLVRPTLKNNLKPGTSVLILIVGSKWFGEIFSLTSGIPAALRGFAVLACPLLETVERLTEDLGLATILQSGLRPCLYDIFFGINP